MSHETLSPAPLQPEEELLQPVVTDGVVMPEVGAEQVMAPEAAEETPWILNAPLTQLKRDMWEKAADHGQFSGWQKAALQDAINRKVVPEDTDLYDFRDNVLAEDAAWRAADGQSGEVAPESFESEATAAPEPEVFVAAATSSDPSAEAAAAGENAGQPAGREAAAAAPERIDYRSSIEQLETARTSLLAQATPDAETLGQALVVFSSNAVPARVQEDAGYGNDALDVLEDLTYFRHPENTEFVNKFEDQLTDEEWELHAAAEALYEEADPVQWVLSAEDRATLDEARDNFMATPADSPWRKYIEQVDRKFALSDAIETAADSMESEDWKDSQNYLAHLGRRMVEQAAERAAENAAQQPTEKSRSVMTALERSGTDLAFINDPRFFEHPGKAEQPFEYQVHGPVKQPEGEMSKVIQDIFAAAEQTEGAQPAEKNHSPRHAAPGALRRARSKAHQLYLAAGARRKMAMGTVLNKLANGKAKEIELNPAESRKRRIHFGKAAAAALLAGVVAKGVTSEVSAEQPQAGDVVVTSTAQN